MQNIKKELQAAYQNMMRKQKIEIHLVNLKKRIKSYENEVERLYQIVIKEEEDFRKLKRLNLPSIFRKVLGPKEKELEKGRQEYLFAVLKYQGYVKSLNTLKFEKEVLEKQLSSLHKSKDYFEKIFAKNEKNIESKASPKAKQKIKVIDLKLLNHEARIKEIRDAINAGKKAEKILTRLIKDLSLITLWGNPYSGVKNRAVFGKKNLSSLRKKDIINNSKRDAHKANILLEHFETEIQDIHKHFKIDYRGYIKSFEDFLDIFYDNLITDWIVKHDVKNTSFAIQTIHDKVVRILAMLETEITKTKKFIKEERLVRKQILIEDG